MGDLETNAQLARPGSGPMIHRFKIVLIGILVLGAVGAASRWAWVRAHRTTTTARTRGHLTAQILQDENPFCFMLCRRDYLQIREPRTGMIYTDPRDLLDGYGGYESAVIDLKWISETRVRVERIIADHRYDLIFDTVSNKFTDAGGPTEESNL